MQLRATPQSNSQPLKNACGSSSVASHRETTQEQNHTKKTLKGKSYQLELPAPVVGVLDATVCPQGSDGWQVV